MSLSDIFGNALEADRLISRILGLASMATGVALLAVTYLKAAEPSGGGTPVLWFLLLYAHFVVTLFSILGSIRKKKLVYLGMATWSLSTFIAIPRVDRQAVEARDQKIMALGPALADRMRSEIENRDWQRNEEIALAESIRSNGYSFFPVLIRKRADDSAFIRMYFSGTRIGYIYDSRGRLDQEDSNGLSLRPLSANLFGFSHTTID